MKTALKIVSAAFVGAVLLTSQAFAASGSLYGLDAWEHGQEGHMAADSDIKLDSLNSAGGGNVEDPWGVDIHSN
ncbi:hypothetical protein QKW35_10060 [Pontibacterium granulatum]|uniref:hypothetical protein n=1 Tax=Pontibacterium granulatum TaxID=2036029 RepID=UPI002499CCF5|nr:hypothetical protein [Pontibacterium granulatum]MDI3324720.1 hypothetical protein [Pontibacterium granulatum]